MKKTKYYSLNKILEKNCTYNVIFGERSNGKTYSVLKYGLEQFCKNHGQIAIVRRWKEDITGKRASDIFSALLVNDEMYHISKGKYGGICYYAGRFYACNYDKENKPLYNEKTDCLGYVFALSDTEHNKSISYPNVTTILFDEFITNHVYLNDEFILFMNTVSTIVRQRTNVKIFMCGNTVNKYCPYFDEMGLKHILKMNKGDIDVYTYGKSDLTVAVEYCGNTATKENNYYFAFDNPKLHMITEGAWEINLYPHCPCKYKPKNIIFTYFIKFQNRLFQCEIIDVDGNMFTFIHEKTTELKNPDSDLVYSLDYDIRLNYNRNILHPINKLQEKILWFYKTDRVFYQNNDVGDCINNYIKVCKGVTVV